MSSLRLSSPWVSSGPWPVTQMLEEGLLLEDSEVSAGHTDQELGVREVSCRRLRETPPWQQ